MVRRFNCNKTEDGRDCIWTYMLQNGDDYIINAVVSSESEYTIFYAMDFEVDVSTLEKTMARVGDELIPIYKLEVESLSFGEGYDSCIGENCCIYVSELEQFIEYAVLGMDYLSQMNVYNRRDGIVLEFETIDMSHEVYEKKRKNYLEYDVETQIKIELTDFFFVEDEIYPDEFELILVIDKQGNLSAGCVDKGYQYSENNPHGVICQSRGGVMFFEDIIAWKPIDG